MAAIVAQRARDREGLPADASACCNRRRVSNGLEAWAQVLATPDLRGEEAMMNHARLIVVLFLLASAGTVFAECAWVLWVNEWFDAIPARMLAGDRTIWPISRPRTSPWFSR